MAAEASGTQDSGARVSTDDLLAGIPVTAAGKERARRELEEFDRHWTPERWAALRDRLGVAPRPAAG